MFRFAGLIYWWVHPDSLTDSVAGRAKREREVTEVPTFTEDIRTILLDKVLEKIDWSEIWPTIFGGIFASTLNPETRRASATLDWRGLS